MHPVLSIITIILVVVAGILVFGLLFIMIAVSKFKHTKVGIFVEYYFLSLEKYNSVVDMYCNIMLMRHELNPELLRKGQYQLDFGNGNTIWIANKYYGYGDITINGEKLRGKPAYNTFVKIIKLERELDSCLN